MTDRSRDTNGYLLLLLRDLQKRIAEIVAQADTTVPDMHICTGCGHSDRDHTQYRSRCVALVPCDCAAIDAQPESAEQLISKLLKAPLKLWDFPDPDPVVYYDGDDALEGIPNMTVAELRSVCQRMFELNQESAHYAECSKNHLTCLIIRLANELKFLRPSYDRLSKRMWDERTWLQRKPVGESGEKCGHLTNNDWWRFPFCPYCGTEL